MKINPDQVQAIADQIKYETQVTCIEEYLEVRQCEVGVARDALQHGVALEAIPGVPVGARCELDRKRGRDQAPGSGEGAHPVVRGGSKFRSTA